MADSWREIERDARAAPGISRREHFPKRIIILGTGGNCIDILEALRAINGQSGMEAYQCIGFLDDDASRWGETVAGVKVLGPLRSAPEFEGCVFVNGIGSPRNYRRKEHIIATAGLPVERFETVVHPTAAISPSASLGPGTVVLQNAVVASRVRIGCHVIVLPGAVISHDCTIGDYTCIASAACISGGATVGRASYIGANSSIIERATLGDGCLVGLGSVVLRDVPANAVYVGNPARRLRSAADA